MVTGVLEGGELTRTGITLWIMIPQIALGLGSAQIIEHMGTWFGPFNPLYPFSSASEVTGGDQEEQAASP